MATATSTVQMNITGNALQQLTKIKTQVDGVGKSFGGLQRVLGGIAITTVIQNTLRWAASIKDVADATGFATEAVLGFTKAVQENGGTAENATAAMNKFILTISEAADGSYVTQEAFSQVGVSLQDLRTLSEQDLFEKAIKGLANIKDVAERARVSNELFGKSLRGVKLDSLGVDYQTAATQSKTYVAAVESADRTQKQLERTLYDLRIVLLTVLKPLADFTSGISTNTDTLVRWAKIIGEAIFEVGKILLYFVAAWRIFKGVLTGGAWLVKVVKDTGSLAVGIKDLFKALTTPLTRSNLFKELKNYAQEVGWGKAFKILWNAVGDTAFARAGVAALAGTFAGVIAAYRKMKNEVDNFDPKKPVVAVEQGVGAAKAMDPARFAQRRYMEQKRQVEEALAKEKAGILQIAEAYKRSSDERLKDLDIQALQVNMSQDDIELMNAINELLKTNKDSVQQLRDAQSQLATDSPLRATYEEAIKAIERLLPLEAGATADRIRNLQKQRKDVELLAEDIDLLNKTLGNENTLNQLQNQAQLIGLVGDELENMTIMLNSEADLQNKLLAIEQKRNDLRKQALPQDELQRRLELLAKEEQAERDFAARKLQIEQDLADQTRALRNDTAVATKKYFEDLARSIDPAVLATQKYEAVFKNVENAIDELVTTGKFNFKDFALSIIADLLKIQMRAIVVQAILAAIGAIFGGAKPTLGGGGGSGISTAGFAANGAKPLAGQPFIVGEQGPELFIPKTAGTIVPNGSMNNNQVSAPVTNVVNNYNINAVDAKSVAQLFAENRKSLLGAVGMAQKEMPYMMAG